MVSKDDDFHIKRILTTGCLSRLQLEEPQVDKLKMIQRGRDKEDSFSHLISLHPWTCTLGPHLRHTSQDFVDMKKTSVG